jgi:hypothetical protein
VGHFALLDLEPYLDSQSGSNRQWLSRCYGKAWPSHLHQERSRDFNVSAGNRTRVSTGGGEHLAKSYSNSILLAIWNIYIWSRNNQCRNDPKNRIRIRNKSFRIHKTEILLKTEDTFPSYLLHARLKFYWILFWILRLLTLVPLVSSSVVDQEWFILDSDLTLKNRWAKKSPGHMDIV